MQNVYGVIDETVIYYLQVVAVPLIVIEREERHRWIISS